MNKKKKIVILGGSILIILIICCIFFVSGINKKKNKDIASEGEINSLLKENQTKNTENTSTQKKKDDDVHTEPASQTTSEAMTTQETTSQAEITTQKEIPEDSTEQAENSIDYLEEDNNYANVQTENNVIQEIPQQVTETTTTPVYVGEQTGSEAYIDEVIRLVNVERAKNGLEPLVKSSELCLAADARAYETVTLFDHTRPNGTDCFTILDEYGIAWNAVGENIAAGQLKPADVMASWMDSQGHRGNILGEHFGHIGVGYVSGQGMYGSYWVQIFTN